MFKHLLNFWRGKEFLTVVLEDFDTMIGHAQDMFSSITSVLIHGTDLAPDLKEKIYSRDREVNDLQRKIRKKIIEHLVLQASVDIPVSLVLMSEVKDAERLGDYCKNLFEIIDLHHGVFPKEKYTEYLNNVDRDIMTVFSQTRKCFKESDETLSRSIISKNKDILKLLEKAIENVASSNLPVREAVSFALTARYFKRIAAHLGNIASSVIKPVSDLDYFDEKNY